MCNGQKLKIILLLDKVQKDDGRKKLGRAELSHLSLKRNSEFKEINLPCHVIAQSRGSINEKNQSIFEIKAALLMTFMTNYRQ